MKRNGTKERIIDKFHREQQTDMTALYQSILDETQTGVYVRSLDSYEILYLNRKAREIFHVEEGEELSSVKCYKRFYHQSVACADCPGRMRNIEQTTPQETYLGGRFFAAKGKIIDWCGRDAYVEYLVDITDAKRATEQLRHANERLQQGYEERLMYRERAVTEDVLSTCRVNLTRGIIEEMTVGKKKGYERSYRYKMNYVEQMEPLVLDVWLSQEQNARLSREGLLKSYEENVETVVEEYAAELLDARHVWIRAEVSMMSKPGTGEVIAFIYNRDITQEKLLSHVLEQIMSFEYDEVYVVDSVNGSFRAIAIGQYAPENQVQRGSFREEVEALAARAESEQDRERIRSELEVEMLHSSLREEELHVFEIALLSRNGRQRLKQIRCMYLNPTIGVILITVIDVEDMVQRERRKQEQLAEALEQAREASRAKSQFLARMSHEIRTPMNAIIGLNTIIKGEIDNRSQVLDCSEKLDSASQYLLALLNDILDMSRIESGNMTLAHQPFDSGKFWENVNILAQTQADLKSVRYLFHRQGGENRTYLGDETRLKQIMINLINNAIKFTAEEGYVKVTVEESEAQFGRARIHVQVEDNGIGISESFLPQVFDTFTQEHIGNTTSYKGSGLGLSIARNFARLMDGDITVESTEGKGTIFFVDVLLEVGEAREKRDASAEQDAAAERDLRGRHVLLVEDHPLNTIVAKTLLTKRGLVVTHAENGEQAVKLFADSEEGAFDAILMDIRMPVMDGIEATRLIREMERADAGSVPIIAMTANAYEEDRECTREAGMNAHLAKPIEPKLLFQTLGEFLGADRENK